MYEKQIPTTVTAINNTIQQLDKYNKHVYAESEDGSRHVVYAAYQENDKIVADTPVGQKVIRNAWTY